MESLQQEEDEPDEPPDEPDERKYSTEAQEQSSWPITELESAPRTARPFYPLSDFRAFSSLSTGASLAFPSYLKVSANYYKPEWWREPRRLKNVVMIMEWLPELHSSRNDAHASSSSAPSQGATTSLSDEQRAKLAATCNMIDADGSGTISLEEFSDLLVAVGIQQSHEYNDSTGLSPLRGSGAESLVGPSSPAGAGASLSKDEIARLFRIADTDESGELTFEEVCNALQQHLLFDVQPERHFVAVSLAEAEGLRALLHSRRSQGELLFPGSSASLALRHGALQFETSLGFQAAPEYQRTTAQQCFRLFDSEVDYTTRQVHVVLRALQNNQMKQRAEWFEAVRSCRRRPRRDWRLAPVARIFSIVDEFHLLPASAARHKILMHLSRTKLQPRDLFVQCDVDGDGHLTASELHEGLLQLNIQMEDREVQALINVLFTEADRRISLDEWVRMFYLSAEDESALTSASLAGGTMISASDLPVRDFHLEDHDHDSPMTSRPPSEPDSARQSPARAPRTSIVPARDRPSVVRPPPPRRPLSMLTVVRSPIPSVQLGSFSASGAGLDAEVSRSALNILDVQVDEDDARPPLPREAMTEIVVRLVSQPRLREVWTSLNTMANEKVSLWAPQQGDFADWVMPSKQSFCVGHYGRAGSYSAPQTTPMLPQLQDESVWQPFHKGPWIDSALDQFAPPPRRFRRAWQVKLPDLPSFYAWEPVPPDDRYVALGMVITNTDEPPLTSSVRCLHRSLCCAARAPPEQLWTSKGLGGAQGSLWRVNNLHCVWATDSYDQPRGSGAGGTFWELKEWPFNLNEVVSNSVDTVEKDPEPVSRTPQRLQRLSLPQIFEQSSGTPNESLRSETSEGMY